MIYKEYLEHKIFDNLKNETLNRTLIFVAIIWALLAGYFAFSDLQISILIANQNSVWAKFIQNFGEVPGLVVLLFGTHIYMSSLQFNSILKKFAALPFLFLASVYLLRHLTIVISHGLTGDYQFATQYKIYIIIASFILNALVFYLLNRGENKLPDNINLFGKVTVFLGIFGYLLYVQPLKLIWGRVRFRDLDPSYFSFTPWYIPNGPNGSESFPSGHAAMAWIILPLLLLAINKNRRVKSFLLTLIIFWGLAVSTGRVVIGAHYASDVLFSGMWIIVCFMILLKKFIVKQPVLQGQDNPL
ncbi:phosphatidylglycerophosphatase B [bacterium BMS3Abin03]|nr:phosphatidylglycerophosphatase B [bacterium BMS3Abin03]